MIEVFSGTATLCSVAKQYGLDGSLALDKTKKRGAKATIFVFDILDPKDKELLYHWLESDVLAWVHIAPVCGTCSRARQIRNGGPRPLRSDTFPMGLPDLTPDERHRVNLANAMYVESCALFQFCALRGILVAMENPTNSLFWLTEPFVNLQQSIDLFHSDTQMCMMGGSRPKWTRLVANFNAIDELNVACDNSHQHQPWGKAKDAQGQEVYATSLEAEYPRRFCIALVQCILRQLQRQGLTLLPNSLFDVKDNKIFEMQTARIAAFNQPRKNKLPPLMPESSSIGVFYIAHASDIPLALHSKSTKLLDAFTKTGELATIPLHARFLRRTATTSPFSIRGGLQQGDACFEVAFGLPWSYNNFITRAAELGHPANFCKQVPEDIQEAINFQVNHSFEEVSQQRLDWCKRWLRRAAELDIAEREAAADRHPATAKKRLKLTREILESLNYEDVDVLQLLEKGSTLAGEIDSSCMFQPSFKPCITTVQQLESHAEMRNKLVMRMTKSSGDKALDEAVLKETQNEVACGWADGPWSLEELEYGATISRRFPLQQGSKIRMIDDYSVSGVNDSCTIHTKLDLHVVDTFIAAVRSYFDGMKASGRDMSLVAKTYDLKSAYRQVPIRADHLKFGYFCIYNCETDQVEVYRSRTLPFGATHSVFSFLRLARMIHCIVCRGAGLITTNFYDDFILASNECLKESSKNCMELIFLFTGWDFATEGKKATTFAQVCCALGVAFNLNRSCHGVLEICNTEARVADLIQQIQSFLELGTMSRHETLKLRGRLGFADGFLHGRLGALILKRLIDHAYGSNPSVDNELAHLLRLMCVRLETAGPKTVDAASFNEWLVFTDASYEKETKTGGLGAVLVDSAGQCRAWFSTKLDTDMCAGFGANDKDNIIYELELLAACLALDVWKEFLKASYPVVYTDNDSVRHALIRGVGLGMVAGTIMSLHLQMEVTNNTSAWFARVPTEANIADIPSRFQLHPFFEDGLNDSDKAAERTTFFLTEVMGARQMKGKRGR